MTQWNMQQSELHAQIKLMPTQADREAYMRGIRMSLMNHHAEHDKNTVCLPCLNRRLQKMPWTHTPGQRAMVLTRFVQPPRRQGRFDIRRYEAGRRP